MAVTFVFIVFAILFAEAFSLSVQRQDNVFYSKAEYDFLRALLGSEHRRRARDVDMTHPPKCCGDKGIMVTEEDHKVMQECEPHGNVGATTACWMECMGQKKHSVDADGYVIKENFTTQYLKHFTDESIKDFTVKSIEECVIYGNEQSKKMGPEESNGNKCNRATLLTSFCVRYKVETGCPENEKIKTDECNQVREDIKAWKSKIE
ncbi:hypothetical protein L9F63_013151 [Diploptera punctata]|uniref:Chemosensory protein n=1 Tax=Diploptera punctata TaxID=6984 RepID=A0AAD8AAS6_DIPPU|nr:hypothetical protein L9F63_013151 [Diploptera punctata]